MGNSRHENTGGQWDCWVQRSTLRVSLIACGYKKEGSSLKTSPGGEMKRGGMAAVNDASLLHLVSY